MIIAGTLIIPAMSALAATVSKGSFDRSSRIKIRSETQAAVKLAATGKRIANQTLSASAVSSGDGSV